MSDTIWYSKNLHIWILETPDRGLFFQPSHPDRGPIDSMWAKVPEKLRYLALAAKPTSPISYTNLYKEN